MPTAASLTPPNGFSMPSTPKGTLMRPAGMAVWRRGAEGGAAAVFSRVGREDDRGGKASAGVRAGGKRRRRRDREAGAAESGAGCEPCPSRNSLGMAGTGGGGGESWCRRKGFHRLDFFGVTVL